MSSIWVIVEPTAIMAFAIVLAVLGLVIVRRAPTFERHFTENEVAGLLFSAMGVVYGALLAFVVFAVWQSYSDAQQAVTQEAASAIAAYRDTQEFPEPQRTQAQADLRAYVDEVMAHEWLTMPAMADMSASSATIAPPPSASMAMDASPAAASAVATSAMPMTTPSASPSTAAMPSTSPAVDAMPSPTKSPSMATPSASMVAMPSPTRSPSMAAMPSPTTAMRATASPSMTMGATPSPADLMATPSASPGVAMTPSPVPASASPSMAMAAPSASPSFAPTPSPTMSMRVAADPLNSLWAIYRSVAVSSRQQVASTVAAQDPASAAPNGELATLELNSAYDRLHALELQRHLRHLSGESTLPWIFWPLLLMGGVILVGFTYFFHQDSHVSQALMTGVVTALLAGVLLLIFALNQPFTGPVPVSKMPFEHALAEFQQIDQAP